MKCVVARLAVWVLLMSTSSLCARAASEAALSGVVRDAQGTPQMGALVELLSTDATVVARAFTDDRGRYLLPSLLPGKYQLRASAAFLVPAFRGDVRLSSGVRAVANLTMTALFSAGAWLPARTRSVTEPADDWQWTLRSVANRPLLRLAGDTQNGAGVALAPADADGTPSHVSDGQILLLAGDGAFGEGGVRQVLTVAHAHVNGETSLLRAALQDDPAGNGPSFALSAGLEHSRPLGGGNRLWVSVASHPEIQAGDGAGLQLLRTAATDKVVLGDTFVIDAGTLFTAERLLGTRFDSAPYVRVAFRPAASAVLEYRMATDRALQATEDLDRGALPVEVASDAQGLPLLRRGLHQELTATRNAGRSALSVAVFHDVLPLEVVQGVGTADAQALSGLPEVTDLETGMMHLAVRGMTASGMRISWSQTFSPAISASVEGEFGKALESNGPGLTQSNFTSSLRAHDAAALVASVQTGVKRTGSLIDVRYRWQPTGTLTQVDEFDTAPEDAYLGVRLKQRLWSGRRLRGVSAVIEATNLLAQGYEPLLGADGKTLFLAQVPRGIMGGIGFSF